VIERVRKRRESPTDALTEMCQLLPVKCTIQDTASKMWTNSMFYPYNLWYLKAVGPVMGEFTLASIDGNADFAVNWVFGPSLRTSNRRICDDLSCVCHEIRKHDAEITID
jgi:hypothetical protein